MMRIWSYPLYPNCFLCHVQHYSRVSSYSQNRIFPTLILFLADSHSAQIQINSARIRKTPHEITAFHTNSRPERIRNVPHEFTSFHTNPQSSTRAARIRTNPHEHVINFPHSICLNTPTATMIANNARMIASNANNVIVIHVGCIYENLQLVYMFAFLVGKHSHETPHQLPHDLVRLSEPTHSMTIKTAFEALLILA
jgi:hypothetical protein